MAIDNFSRDLYAAILPDKTQNSSKAFLEQVLEECPYTIEQFYSDNGKEYRGTPEHHAFMKSCLANSIEQCFARVRTQRTDGEAERVIKTIMDMWHKKTLFRSSAHRKTELTRFINYYNGDRPHKGIDGLTPNVKDLIPPFSRLYFDPMTVKKYMEAMERRDMLISSLETFLSEWDAWLCPVAATPAFEHLEPDFYMGPLPYYFTPIYIDEQPVDYYVANVSFTTVFNLTGSPAVTIPIGSTEEGLPLCIQAVGRRWRDMELLSVAEQLAEVAGSWQPPPGY